MKKPIQRLNFKFNPKLLFAITTGMLTLSSTSSAVDVSINGSNNLSLTGNVVYNYQTNPRSLGFQVDAPFLCTSIFNSGSPTILNVNDPNGASVSTNNDGILSTIYDLSNNQIKIVTDNSIQCASESGMHRETIYNHSFESFENDLEITILDEFGSPLANDIAFTNGQTFNYQYVIKNNSNVSLIADVVEFYRIDASIPFFQGVSGDEWICSENTSFAGSNTSCGDTLPGNGEDNVNLKNARIDAGEELIVDVSRIANVPANMIGVGIELLAAVFTTVSSDSDTENNIIFEVFNTTDNVAPEITTFFNQNINEDSSSSVLNFSVSDSETPSNALVVTASSSNQFMLPSSSLILGGVGSNRTLQIVPPANINTVLLPLSVTVSVNDGSTITDTNFNLTINPVNDKPTFNLDFIPDHLAGSTGLFVEKSFIKRLDTGGASDENNQAIINSSVVFQSGTSGIFVQGGEPQLTNNGVLSYFLSGAGGTAVFDVILQDNGGTSNGGENTSDPVSFSITVLNTLPEISPMNNISLDEDDVSSLLPFTISDAETSANALVMTAISSDNNIIDTNDIQFSGTGENRFVQLTPNSNQNTVVDGDVTITLIVDDGSNTSESSFDMTINPINDAPSFSLQGDITPWAEGTTGLRQHPNHAENISMGPTSDEDISQTVDTFNVNITGDAIFAQFGEPVLDTSGSLAYVLNGTSGVATVEVSLSDDGGTANSGVDTSGSQFFTITVLDPIP